MPNKIKWGIIGLGRIANSFAGDLLHVKEAELVVVASTNKKRAKLFAAKFSVKTYYDNYDNLFKDQNVDIIYVATVHTSHAEFSIKAMSYKKHVLCEKPLAINFTDAKKMIEASLKNNVFFMEGLWSRFNPSIKKTLQLISSGEIGKPCYLNAEFAFYALDKNPASRLLNIELGGGSLLDIGIYPIFLAYLLFGKPKEILATSKFFHTGAEIQTSIIFNYDNAEAILYSSLANNSDMVAKIGGDKGEIFIDSRWHESDGLTLVKNSAKTRFDLPTQGNGFIPEINEVHDCIKNQQIESEMWSHQNSIDLINIIDKVRKIVGVKFPSEKL